MSGGPASSPLPSWLVRLNNARELWAEFLRDRDSDAMLGTKPAGLSPEGVAARAAESGIAQPTPSENINGK